MYQFLNSKREAGDRFIPRRMGTNGAVISQSPFTLTDFYDTGDSYYKFVNVAKKRNNAENYQKTLQAGLFPERSQRLLNFFSEKKRRRRRGAAGCTADLWPVKGRDRPAICYPTYILDMPNFDSCIAHHVVDWNSLGCLATIYENEVHMWYPGSKSSRYITRTSKLLQYCVKWNSTGTKLAVGLISGGLAIWDTEQKKVGKCTHCCLNCDIMVIEWAKKGGYLISGCSRGFLKKLSPQMETEGIVKAYNSCIINMAASCNQKFLVTTAVRADVKIWQLPCLSAWIRIKTACANIRAIAWHPWKDSLLAVGLGGKIVLWNVDTVKEVARKTASEYYTEVSCLTFNPISGELVVSYYTGNLYDAEFSTISVYTNFEKVVEELHIHEGRVLYLLWGDGGKTLASVSSDENLCIWNFFQCEKESETKSKTTQKLVYNNIEGSVLYSNMTIR